MLSKIGSDFSKKREIFEKVLLKELDMLGSPLVRFHKEEIKNGDFNIVLNEGKKLLYEHKDIEVFNSKIEELNTNEINVIATGNNTNDKLADFLISYLGSMNCFKNIAIFPKFERIDEKCLYKNEKDKRIYLPLTEEEYKSFLKSTREILDRFDKRDFVEKTFEWFACLGDDALRNNCFMPVFIPEINYKPYAVLKFLPTDCGLKLEEVSSNLHFNIQEEIFLHLNGFENAKLIKKSELADACILNPRFAINEFGQSLRDKNLFFVGSILGIEGALDSIATGLAVGVHINKYFNDYQMEPFPKETCIGAIINKILSINELKPILFHGEYGIITDERELKDKKIVDKLFSRSSENLRIFKEKYNNGKHV